MEWTPNQIVAYNLQRIRRAKDMTQEEACQATAPYLPGGGWSRAVWSAAERSIAGNRIRNFDADIITAMAVGFDVPVSRFFLPPSPEEVPLELVRADGADRGVSIPKALRDVSVPAGEIDLVRNHLEKALDLMGGSTFSVTASS